MPLQATMRRVAREVGQELLTLLLAVALLLLPAAATPGHAATPDHAGICLADAGAEAPTPPAHPGDAGCCLLFCAGAGLATLLPPAPPAARPPTPRTARVLPPVTAPDAARPAPAHRYAARAPPATA